MFPAAYSGNWRKKLPELENPEVMTGLNYDGVGLMLLYSVTNIDAFRNPRQGENPRLATLRLETNRGLRLASDGKIQSLLKIADETLPDIRKALLKTPPSEFATMSVSAVVVGQESSMVFLVPAFNAGYCMSFLLKGSEKQAEIKRVDVVIYEGMYKHLERIGELD